MQTNRQRNVPGQRFAMLALIGAANVGLLTAGCSPSGPKTYLVSGSVTLDSKPIAEGYITFSPQQRGETPVAGKIEEGQYAIYATAGVKRVSIQASHFIGPENPIMGLRAKEQYIPERYNLESMLSETVSPTVENQFDFELTSKEEASVAPNLR
jgi:hypothetical protein